MTAISRLMLVVMGVVLWLNVCDAQTTLEPPSNPNSAKACAICHYRWVDTFFIEGIVWFYFTVEFDDQGNPVKLVGNYDDGRIDETKRTK